MFISFKKLNHMKILNMNSELLIDIEFMCLIIFIYIQYINLKCIIFFNFVVNGIKINFKGKKKNLKNDLTSIFI